MKTPYLVQRCSINRPLNDFKGEKFSKAASLDYMGSSEFEWGAVPDSLRALQAGLDNIVVTSTEEITNNGANLRVLHMFSPEEFKEYFKFIIQMRNGKLRLKESTKFEPDARQSSYAPTDLWWDIENHVMWSFDKAFMARLPDHLVASWKYMDEQKKD